MNSRNGVVVDRERIINRTLLSPTMVISLGTSSFIIIDREAPSQTIVSSLPEEKEEKVYEEEFTREEVLQPAAPAVALPKPTKPLFGVGSLLLF